jgi:hypothetical protein
VAGQADGGGGGELAVDAPIFREMFDEPIDQPAGTSRVLGHGRMMHDVSARDKNEGKK